MKYFVGAYATAPVTERWEPETQAVYYTGLKQMPNIRGLEHPFTGSLHGEDDDWFLANIDPSWDYLFTGMPGVMGRLGKNENFGLASTNEAGQAAALEFYQQMQQAVVKLNSHLGRPAVKAILLQASPRVGSAGSPTVEALAAALETLKTWDWQGAELVLEHCDAYRPGLEAQKGFLTLEQELAAVSAANKAPGSPIGLCVNWGRSVLEQRSVEGAVDHIRAAKAAGLLRGLMFSGVSGTESEYGAWKDTHMPPAQVDNNRAYEPTSLLTGTEIERCLAESEAEALPFTGIKIGVRPHNLSVVDRLSYIQQTLAALDRHSVSTV